MTDPFLYNTDLVLDDLRGQVRMAGSQKALAAKLGVSPAYLNDILARRREISAEFAKRIGYERQIHFVWVGDKR